MAESQGKSILDFVQGFKRRWWVVALCFFIVAPIGAGVAYVLPPSFAATAKIIVESQQIPDDLARTTVTASPSERVELIRQLLTTRQNLVSIIEKHNLYSTTPLTLSQKVDRLRNSVVIDVFQAGSSGRRGPAVLGFTVTAKAPQSLMSATIANEFVTLALDLNLKQRTERATETVAFFANEVNRLTREIEAAEAALVDFKQKNADALPEAAQFRQSQLLALQQTELQLEQQRSSLQDQKSDLEFLLKSNRVGPDGGAQLTPTQEQLVALKGALAQQRALLAPSHPTIRAMEGRIAALERQAAAEQPTDKPDEAVSFEHERMIRQIDRIDEQVAKVDERLAETRAEIASYREALTRTTAVEFELRRLDTRFTDLQAQRAEAVSKRAEAETGEKLEVNRQAERFVVLEQAQVPRDPEPPGKIVIAGAGVGASLALGAALVVLLELMSQAIMTPADLERRVGLKAIVVIPYIRTRREVWARRIRFALIALVILVGAPAAFWAVDQYVAPLSIIAEKLMDKTGLRTLFQLVAMKF